MPPSNLQGLDIVHPAQDSSNSQDLLLGHGYPDLSAQLDLWTNLNFTEESHGTRIPEPKPVEDDEEEQAHSPVTHEKAVRAGHVNVVAPTNVPINPSSTVNPPPFFDLGAFLAGFGLDSFHAQPTQLPQQPAIAPSLAQLLALHPGHTPAFGNGAGPHFNPATPVVNHDVSNKSISASRPVAPASTTDDASPPKRARTRKASVSQSVADSQDGPTSPPPAGVSVAEDKRRRNTAASARFRLKKKEREAALEGKSKELETKVAELERECEGLRRENGWLKGLVVGVTGAAQAPNASNLTVPSSGPVSAGAKRRKDELE